MYTAILKEKPQVVFWLFVGAQILLWTLIPTLVNPNLPLDVIEGLTWGHEWQLGYHKHPPIKPWFIEAMAVLSGKGDWAQYLLSQLCIVVAFGAMWRLARDIMKPPWSLVAVLLMTGIYYHNYTSPEFNVNVAELPFWSLTIVCVWRALKSDANWPWLLAGLFTGLGFLSKYIFMFLILALLVMLCSRRSWRAVWRTPGPYLAAGVALLVVTPHLVWVVDNDFITVVYGIDRVGVARKTIFDHLYYPFKFLMGQSLILIPCLIMLWTLKGPRRKPAPARDHSEIRAFLLFVSLGPPILMALLSGIGGWKLRSMWGTPLFLTAGVTLVYFWQHYLAEKRLRRFMVVWMIFFLLPLVAYASVGLWGPEFTGRGKRTQFPGQALADVVFTRWYARFAEPPAMIIGEFWNAGNISYHSPTRPSVFIDADPKKAPWINIDRIATQGAIVIGENKADAYHLVPAPYTEVLDEGQLTLPYRFRGDVPPVTLWLLFIPPTSPGHQSVIKGANRAAP
jgi:4-amino-4-deoxy-L-arabinose transferase-like glycosyltransferase